MLKAFLTWTLLCLMPEPGLTSAGWSTSQTPQATTPADTQPQTGEPAVERDEHIRVRTFGGSRVRIGGSIVVERGESVEQAVAILGDLIVRGDVHGDAVAVMGSVRVEDGASVGGQVVAVGGQIELAPTAKIAGSADQVAIGFPEIRVDGPGYDSFRFRLLPDRDWLAGFALGGSLLRLTALLLLALTAAIVFTPAVQRIADQAAAGPAESLIIGLGLQLLLVPVLFAICIALAVSLIGLPLVPVVIALAGGLWLVGFAGAAAALGRGILRVAVVGRPSVAMAVVVGGAPFALLTLASRFGWWAGGGWSRWWLVVAVAGLLIEAVLWSVGAGAFLLAWFKRTTPTAAPHVQPPVPPPAPALPVQP
jgi:hypothetical protein